MSAETDLFVVPNGGFESPALAAGVTESEIPNWGTSGDAGVSQGGFERTAFAGQQYAALRSGDVRGSSITATLPTLPSAKRLVFRIARPGDAGGALVQVFAGERVIATVVPVEGENWERVETLPVEPSEEVRFAVGPSKVPGVALIDDVRILP